MRSLKVLGALAVVAALTVLLAVVPLARWEILRSDPMQSKFSRIRSGMSEADVFAILGQPGEHGPKLFSLGVLTENDQLWLREHRADSRMWWTDRGAYVVQLDYHGRVKEYRFLKRRDRP